MVKYKLGISSRKESRIIDLDSIIKINNLEKLDELTAAFKNEEQLKIYLFNQGLLNIDELSKKLNIMYTYGGKVKKLPVVYVDMKKYLDTINSKYLLKNMSNDIEFLEKLARHYSIGNEKFNLQGQNVHDIRLYISDVRSNGGNNFYSKSLDYALGDLHQKACFKLVNKDTGEIKPNYRGIRDLGFFIYNYEIKKKLTEEKANILNGEYSQIDLFDDIFPIHQNVDNSINEEIDDYEEPLFSPNSEDERDYFEHLRREEEIAENEPIENHAHYERGR